MDLKIRNRRALVFGASQGLGRAVARALVDEGVRVVIASRRAEALQRTAADIGAAGVVVCNLTHPGVAATAVQDASRQLGGIDILVCNTGGPPQGDVAAVSNAQWEQSFYGLFMSVVDAVRAARPHMEAQRWGRILLVTSTSAREPLASMAISNAMRAGLAGLAKSLSNELAPLGITVNVLMPGATNTERLRELGMTEEKAARQIPAGRLGKPEEFAAMAAFLASEQAAYVCGQAIAIDGGRMRGL